MSECKWGSKDGKQTPREMYAIVISRNTGNAGCRDIEFAQALDLIRLPRVRRGFPHTPTPCKHRNGNVVYRKVRLA